MSWTFGSAQSGPQTGNSPQTGDELEEWQTTQLSFKSLQLDTQVRLKLFDPWPQDNLPPTYASLLSVASRRKLLAAAGPDSLLLVDTDDVREQYIPARRKKGDVGNETGEDEPAIKSVQPKLRMPVPRSSHVAFNADESWLMLAAQDGSGLAVYSTVDLLAQKTAPAFRIPTNGQDVRQILPNPNTFQKADYAHQVGLVLSNGQLVLADLRQQTLVTRSDGNAVFHEGVSCAAWSKLGRQIVAGLEDGSAMQIDPEGAVKGQIARPPQLDEVAKDMSEPPPKLIMTAVAWLTTYEFLLVYSPLYGLDDFGPEDSIYIHARRPTKEQPMVYRKAPIGPCPAMGERKPAIPFIQRLSDWSPSLKEALILATSASSEVGLFARLDGDFVQAEVSEDSRKALIPMSILDGLTETSPVGTALDLSAGVLIDHPIPEQSDAIERSPVPLPIYCVLNTDGLIFFWWYIYTDAVKAKSLYPGLTQQTGPYKQMQDFQTTAVSSAAPNASNGRPEEAQGKAEQSTQGQPAPQPEKGLFGNNSAGSAPLASPFNSFGASTATSPPPRNSAPAFGAPSTPGFGSASNLGNKSAWGSATPTNGASTFGNPSVFGSTSQSGQTGGFGQVGGLGVNRGSPWSTAQGSAGPPGHFGGSSTPASGFSAFASGNKTKASPFASANNPPISGIFGAPSKPSLTQEASMGSTATLGSTGSSFSFGQPSATPTGSFGSRATLFGEIKTDNDGFKKPALPNGGESKPLGLSGGFKLGSTFQGDGTAKDDGPKPKDAGAGFFGAGFGDALGSSKTKPAEAAVKQELGTETRPQLRDIPPAPSASSVKSSSRVVNDAPLPPDPTTYKAPKMPDISEILAGGKKPNADDAPLPPDPMTYKAPKMDDISQILGAAKKDTKDTPFAGSPPIDLGNEHLSSGAASDAGPPDDEEEWDDEDEDDADAESDDNEEEDEDEEDEDVEDDDDEPDDEPDDDEEEVTTEVQDRAGLDAFMKRMGPVSPNVTQNISDAGTPASQAQSSYTPKTPHFPPPVARPQATPRSPSPLRAVTSPVRNPHSGNLELPPTIKPMSMPPPKPDPKPEPSILQPRPPMVDDLQDENDARIRAILDAPVAPSRDMPTFYVHSEYQATSERSGLAGQIDKVFQDVNCMINIFGLNARSLQAFVSGHESVSSSDLGELDDPDSWALGQLPVLGQKLAALDEQLKDGKLDNVPSTLRELKVEEDQALKIKAKTVELRKQITAHSDPERLAAQEAAPLANDYATQQADLRHNVIKVQKLLSELEEKMALLRADLASAAATQAHAVPAATPTVEAVQNTILKMTTMVEQKSGDIDLLEARIRQLPQGLASLKLADADNYEDALVSGLTNNKLLTAHASSTPPRRPRMAANGDALGMSGMFGSAAFKTPPPAANASLRRSIMGSGALGMSTGSFGRGSARRKKMTDVTIEEVETYNARRARRRDVLGALKKNMESGGVRVDRA